MIVKFLCLSFQSVNLLKKEDEDEKCLINHQKGIMVCY